MAATRYAGGWVCTVMRLCFWPAGCAGTRMECQSSTKASAKGRLYPRVDDRFQPWGVTPWRRWTVVKALSGVVMLSPEQHRQESSNSAPARLDHDRCRAYSRLGDTAMPVRTSIALVRSSRGSIERVLPSSICLT